MGGLTEEQKKGIAESAIRMEEEREVRREALEQRAIQQKQDAMMKRGLDMDCGKAARQAYWSEVPLDEKCERLRSEVKRLQRDMGRVLESIALLLVHDHNARGEIVATLDSIRTSGIRGQEEARGRGPGKDDVYF